MVRQTAGCERTMSDDRKTDTSIAIPDAIYGREEPLAELMEAYRWAALGATELVLISGPPGIGKSALVHDAFRPAIWNRSSFAWGKFDAYSRSKPYGIWIQCFRFLIRRMLTEPEEALNRWKTRMAEAAGGNLPVLADEIPELRLLFDGLPPAAPLPPKENQNRFERVIRGLVHTLTGPRRPLVLFLDDLQWADQASLMLLQSLLEDPESRHLCIIGAHRDGEWTENADILKRWLSGEPAGFSVRRIPLDHLSVEDARRMVDDALGITADDGLPLTQLLYAKSLGNPFYLKHLLRSALDEGIVRLEQKEQRWRWDEDQLNSLPDIEGSIGHLTGRIGRLPGEAGDLLARASTLGGIFTSRLVSAIAGMDEREAVARLEQAVRAGFLSVRGEENGTVRYAFAHDRILQAAGSLLDDAERRSLHLAAGMYLLGLRETGSSVEAYEIANHLNEAGDLPDERLTEACVRLNVEAGRLAMKSSDYDSALRHYRKALRLMPARAWQERQAWAFETLLACCECEYLCANFEQAEAMLDDALARASGWSQRARVVKLKVDQYSNKGQYARAIECGLAVIREVGIRVSAAPSPWTARLEVMRTKRLFRRHARRLGALPPANDPDLDRLAELCASLVGPAFFTNRGVLAVLTSQLIRHFFRRGAPVGLEAVYVAFAMVLTTKYGDFIDGHRIGRMAVELAERSGDPVLLSKTHILFHAVVSQWMGAGDRAAEQLQEAARNCVESGDYVFGSYALGGLINLSYGGLPIRDFDRLLRQSLQISELTNEELVYTNIEIYMKWCEQLGSSDCRAFVLAPDRGDEERALADIGQQEGGAVTLYQIYTYKTQAHYLFGDPEEAIRSARMADPYEPSAVQSPHKIIHHVYEALALAAVSRTRDLGAAERSRLGARLREFRRWARRAPDRFDHLSRLVRAEVLSVTGRDSDCIRLYDEAIRHARDIRDWQMWAVACECAAAYHGGRGRERVADGYLREACEAYDRWGAKAKLAELRGRHGERLSGEGPETAGAVEEPAEEALPAVDAGEDEWLLTLKESLLFPADMNFERTRTLLFNRMMEISQAAYGCLISAQDELKVLKQWHGGNRGGGRQAKRVRIGSAAPLTLVQYAIRVGTPVQVKDLEADELFRFDPYVRRSRSAAACCIPVRLQEETAGALYLEVPPDIHPLEERKIHALTMLAAQLLFYTRLSETIREEPAADGAAADGRSAEARAANGREADAPEIGPVAPLSEREYEVLQLISQGLTNKEIAARLGVTPGTVKVHTNNIFNKLNVNRRTQAVAQARKWRLLDP